MGLGPRGEFDNLVSALLRASIGMLGMERPRVVQRNVNTRIGKGGLRWPVPERPRGTGPNSMHGACMGLAGAQLRLGVCTVHSRQEKSQRNLA